ncbi:MAG: DUF937 domain-containing protein [Cyanobacteriota bacterium]|nr:DUF937 domain-containing protein [Cyanobacteriota bacterium]
MSLFDKILGAIDDPNKQANPNQLAGILSTVQQLSSSTGTNPDAMQSAVGIVGKYVRSSLQQKRATEGEQQVQSIVNRFSGTQPSNQAVNLLFGAPQVQSMIREIETRTGLGAGTIQSLLPMIVPLVLNFLQTGSNTQNPQSSANPVLSGFLDSDGDGDVDMMDAMRMASRYLNK